MKLTKQQRHMAYMIMLAEFRKDKQGLCLVWYYMVDEVGWCNDEYNLKIQLPELWSKADANPIRSVDSWFSSNRKRLDALKQCIEETADAWPK